MNSSNDPRTPETRGRATLTASALICLIVGGVGSIVVATAIDQWPNVVAVIAGGLLVCLMCTGITLGAFELVEACRDRRAGRSKGANRRHRR